MNTIEYLMKEFEIDEERAKEVSEKMKELAHQHHHHESEKTDLKDLIVEGQDGIDALRRYSQNLHCNGCGKHCPILSPNCGKGRKTAQVLLQ